MSVNSNLSDAVKRVNDTRAMFARDESRLPGFISALAKLARLRLLDGDKPRARRLAGEAKQHLRDTEKLAPIEVIQLNGQIAFVHESLGNLDDAVAAYQTAIRISEESNLKIHKNIAAVHNNLGMLLKERGNLDEAASHYKTALVILEQVADPVAPEIASVYNNLGVLAYSRYKLPEALRLHKRALRLRGELYGEDSDHYDVLQTWRNLSAVHKSMGNYSEASECFARAGEIENVAPFTEPERESRSIISAEDRHSAIV